MPKINAWESEKFQAKQQASAFNLLVGFLPENTFTADEQQTASSIGTGGDIDLHPDEQEAVLGELQNIIQTYEEDHVYKISLLNTGAPRIIGIPWERGVTLINEYMTKTVNALSNLSAKRGDARIKRFYSDLAEIYDPEDAKLYTQMFFTSPYLPRLAGCFLELVNPTGISSKELKSQLTVPLYNASFDFTHAIAEEIKTEYNIQRYINDNSKRNNYDVENLQINRIYAAHNNTLKQYAKLREFQDDPEGQTRKYIQNSLSHIFGRDGGGGNLDTYIGMIRGENQAIDNGWGLEDRYVLGALGGIEAEIKHQEEYGTPEVKAGLLEFKAKFYELKDSCYYKSVNSAEERMEIAGKVKAFAKAAMAENASPAAKACCVEVTGNIKKFDAIEQAINKRMEWENNDPREKVENRIIANPAGYMGYLYEQAVARKDFKQFVLEYIDVKNKVEDSFRKNDITRQNFENTMRAYLSEENEYSLPIRKSIAELYFEKKVQYGQILEQKAAEVREGIVDIHAELSEIVPENVPEIVPEIVPKRLNIEGNVELPEIDLEKDKIEVNVASQEDVENWAKYDKLKIDLNSKLNKSFGLLRQDPLFAKRMANRLLVESEVNKKLLDLGKLYDSCKLEEEYKDTIKEIKKSYLNNARDGLTKSERRSYFVNGNEHSDSLEGTFGVEDGLLSKYTTLPKLESIVSTVRQENSNVENYIDKFYELQSIASRHLTYLSQLKRGRTNNSQAFNNMYTALERVTNLKVEDSPNKIAETFKNLGDASKGYEDKINAQTFSAILDNGQKRKTESKELQIFAKSSFISLISLPENIEVNEPIGNQLTRINNVQKTLHIEYKAEIEQDIKEKMQEIKENKFKPYDGQKSLEDNKMELAKGIASVLALDSIQLEFNKKDTLLISKDDYAENKLLDNYIRLSSDDAFNSMMEEVKGEEGYNRLSNLAKENPIQLIAELNTHRDNLARKGKDANDVYDNEYISHPKNKSNELKNPSNNKRILQ